MTLTPETGASMLNLDPLNAIPNARRAVQISLTLLEFDPGNIVTTNNLAVARTSLGDAHWTAGQLREALPVLRPVGQGRAAGHLRRRQSLRHQLLYVAYVALRHAQFGDMPEPARSSTRASRTWPGSARAAASGKHRADHRRHDESRWPWRRWRSSAATMPRPTTHRRRHSRENSRHLKPKGGVEEFQKNTLLLWAGLAAGAPAMAAAGLRRCRAALRAALAAASAPGHARRWTTSAPAAASRPGWPWPLARQGKHGRSRQADRARVKYERGLAARNHGDVWVPVELAGALYAQSAHRPRAGPGAAARSHRVARLGAGRYAQHPRRQVWREFIAADARRLALACARTAPRARVRTCSKDRCYRRPSDRATG